MVTRVGADHLSQAVDVVVDLLRPAVDRDWTVPAGRLEWTCRQTAAHVAHDLAKYAAQLAGRAENSYLRFRLVVPEDAPQAELLRVLHACGRLLSEVVSAAPPSARAWHYGPADAAGFAAMGVGELLVHAYDIAQGLGIDWRPPADLCELVVERLLDPSDLDPTSHLLWATGRVDVPGEECAAGWVWQAALS